MYIDQQYTIRVPKNGNTMDECEDWADLKQKTRRSTFAVADGATESAYSGKWARQLVEAFLRTNPHSPRTRARMKRTIEACAKQWAKDVWSRPLPWFMQEKVGQGSFSTLLGLWLHDKRGASEGSWRALAVGDSCLFQIRNNQVILKFPIEYSQQFGYRPSLVSTNPQNNRSWYEATQQIMIEGGWKTGDAFLLMTDALSQWFLESESQGRKPWDELQHVLTKSCPGEENFNLWINQLRESKAMRNDDVALIMFTVRRR